MIKKRKPKSQNRRWIIALIIFGLILLVMGSVIFLYFFERGSLWNKKERLTIALDLKRSQTKSDDVYLFSFAPQERSISVLKLPTNMRITTVGGFGEWKIGSIYTFGENEGNGGELLSKSLAEYLGTEVEGWIFQETDSLLTKDTVKTELKRLLIKSLKEKNEHTNLSVMDLVVLYKDLSSVLSSRIRVEDLQDKNVISSINLPDGAIEYVTDPILIDKLSREQFFEPAFEDEAFTIVVLNSTEHDGLGKQIARTITNLGAKVISIGDYSQSLESSQLIVSNDNLVNSFTIKKLSSLFQIKQPEVKVLDQYRSDIILIVAEDNWLRIEEFKKGRE